MDDTKGGECNRTGGVPYSSIEESGGEDQGLKDRWITQNSEYFNLLKPYVNALVN
jgi:hypothetical protein